jgi:uncharacterized protein YllA (UPF0747 family)
MINEKKLALQAFNYINSKIGFMNRRQRDDIKKHCDDWAIKKIERYGDKLKSPEFVQRRIIQLAMYLLEGMVNIYQEKLDKVKEELEELNDREASLTMIKLYGGEASLTMIKFKV